MNRKLLLCASLFASSFTSAHTKPDALADVMRSTAQKYKNAYVDLTIVMNFSGEGSGRNREIEVPGVILDASGLIVTTSFAIDSGVPGSEVRTKIVSIRVRSAAGVETPGKVVLRDPDRGLAFIRPTQPLANTTAVDFSQSMPVQIGDSVFTLGSLGRSGNRSQRVSTERIVGVIDKPRTIYVLAPSIASPFGNALFNEKGEVVGIVTLKLSKNTGEQNSFNAFDMGLVAVVNGKDIAEAAQQAPQIKDLKEKQ